MEQVVAPTLAEMRRRGAPFVGCLYVGLALTSVGPKVIEFNVRFGDPEAQVKEIQLWKDRLAAAGVTFASNPKQLVVQGGGN